MSEQSGLEAVQTGPVQVADARVFYGPNLFAPVPVLVMTVTAAPRTADQVAGLEATLAKMLDSAAQSLIAARWRRFPPARSNALVGMASSGAAGLLAGLAVRLQALLGHDLQFAAAEPGAGAGESLAVVSFRDLTVARLAARAAQQTLSVLLQSDQTHGGAMAERIMRRFLDIAAARDLSPMATDIVLEAEARGIPWIRSFPAGAQVELGQGCKLQRFLGSYTTRTSYLATMLATNKHQAAVFFRNKGIPATENAVARDENHAVAIASRFGYPVVVKPSSTDYGTAVHTNLGDEAAVRWAYGSARRHGPVLVERHVPGEHHRLLVMYGEVAYVMVHTPARVFGDGQHSIQALVDRENRQRGETFSHDYFKRITLDDQVVGILGEQDLTLESVPDDGQEIRLRMQANISQGGTAVYVDEDVHPDNRDMAVRAARLAGFDVAGVDFITTDISRPFHETGGTICEINPTPGWVETPDRYFTRRLLAPFYPDGEDGRIPIVSLLGGASASEAAELVYRVLAAAGLAAGIATRDGAMIADRSVGYGDFRGRRGSEALLGDSAVEAAVLEISDDLVKSEGLGFDRCSIAVIVGPDEEHAGDAEEELRARATALLATLAQVSVVLLADDPFAITLMESLPPGRVCLVAETSDRTALERHCQAGGTAVLCHDEGTLDLYRAGLVEPESLSPGSPGHLPHRAMGLVCAVAVGLGLDSESLLQGLDF